MDTPDKHDTVDVYIVSIEGPVPADKLPAGAPKRLLLIGAIPITDKLVQAIAKHGNMLKEYAVDIKKSEGLSLLAEATDAERLEIGKSFALPVQDILDGPDWPYLVVGQGKQIKALPPKKERDAARAAHETMLNILSGHHPALPRSTLKNRKPKNPSQ